MRRITLVSLAAIFLALEAHAEEPATLTGTWDVTRGTPEEKFAGFTMTLKQDGEKLTGNIAWPDGKTTEIADGVIKDGQMSFKVRPNDVTHAYGGTVDGNTIKGRWAVTIAVFDWQARRRVAEPLGGPKRDVAERLLTILTGSNDEKARGAALHELRLLGRRADFIGGRRQRRGEAIEPQVTGLVPHLTRAMKDKDENNRINVLYAVADTLEPAAVTVLRDSLRDESEHVRFQAACLLTEFNDASGMSELKAGLKRIQAKPDDVRSMFDLDRLIASFERITGKSFGECPANPMLSSDSKAAANATNQRTKLLNAWAQWWEWTPK